MKVSLLLLVSILSAHTLAARAPVEEIPVNGQQQNGGQQNGTLINQQQTEMFYQLQSLLEEVRQLRGMVEELTYQVDELKQRQQDDYLDLDRRISAAGSAVGVPGAEQPAPGVGQPTLPVAGDDEKQLYGRAQSLLKAKQFDDASAAFENHIASYPSGKLVANSHYWLGQIYMVKGNLDKARQAFAQVVEKYPGSNKALDSALKLGRVYHLQGDNAKARDLLEKVAAGNTEVSQQARDYIDANL
ncbi:tol-pal system protein YbgF [Porticoccus sp. W117]|uniref:tol-pal system protein YbgF n=1 Tax=Porticoccus sp. W117 TaxID=3054777 RepID=UPI0025970915|nr:tol-pal system protein YbgF [Porticoccus sp. W117]MDM3871240.1 tol-pal system protein YbgF [Porticoccus sp. W117]